MRDLTELNKLEEYLKENDIPYVRRDDIPESTDVQKRYFEELGFDFHQIVVPDLNDWAWDCICHKGSFGCEEGLLEIMGCLVEEDGDVEGYLTAEDVIERIKKYGNDKKRTRIKD